MNTAATEGIRVQIASLIMTAAKLVSVSIHSVHRHSLGQRGFVAHHLQHIIHVLDDALNTFKNVGSGQG